MKRISFLLVGTVLFMQTGCASLVRSHSSGYAYRNLDLGAAGDRRQAEREASAQELGISDPNDVSGEDDLAIRKRSALRKAERTIEGKKEKEQYYKNKAYLKSDEDRMQLLSLPSLEARAQWLQRKGIDGASTEHSPEIQALIEVNDITLGMTKQAVKESWGEPELVEVAGNPLYGNERWHYTEEISSTEGFLSERRMVYFESGRVVGWEKR
jgi:hypothetical protein